MKFHTCLVDKLYDIASGDFTELLALYPHLFEAVGTAVKEKMKAKGSQKRDEDDDEEGSDGDEDSEGEEEEAMDVDDDDDRMIHLIGPACHQCLEKIKVRIHGTKRIFGGLFVFKVKENLGVTDNQMVISNY